ncbi:MAG: hypothetical protein MSIBF_00555 [Candidatus Altiarchaeales archaeon IMC4]|nr:MAG: hypothetical protein MSIBF_00555 [Candidatus Altiarchaeales archaeon IMC4]
MQKKVIDSSAVLHSSIDFSDGGYLMTNDAFGEIISDNAKSVLNSALRMGFLSISDPTEKYTSSVAKAAKDTGDIESLSMTDIRLLALALEKKAMLLTDDYAIQNVAKKLNVPFVSVAKEGITKDIQWVWLCRGCGKKYPNAIRSCGVCGGLVSRRNI